MLRLLALSALLALAINACGDDAGTPPSGTSTPLSSAPPPTLSPDAPVPVPLYPGELHLQPAAGGPSTKIASYPGWFVDSAWSSPGDFALSVYLSSRRTELHVFDNQSFNDRFAVLDGMVEELIWSPDGLRLAFKVSDQGSAHYRLAVLSQWDFALVTLVAPVGVTGDSRPVGWLSNDRLLAVYGESVLVEFDLASKSSRFVLDLGARIRTPVISPDGSSFLVTDCVPGANEAPIVVYVQTGDRHQLDGLPCDILTAVWSPDGDQLAYGRIDREGDTGGLYLFEIDAVEPRHLLSANYPIFVEWSTDGGTVFVQTSGCYGCEASFFGLHAVDAATGAARLISRGATLQFSPDKGRGAFVDAERGVSVIDMTTGIEHQVVAPQSEVAFNVQGWRPGADAFLVASDVSTTHQYDFALNVDGTGFEAYPWPDGADQVLPTADHTRIAVIEHEGAQQYEPGRLSILDAATGVRTEIPLPNVLGVLWAPDNQHLLAAANETNDFAADPKLYLLNTEGPSVIPLDIDPYSGFTAWSPDSSTIAFRGEYDHPSMFLLDVESLEVTRFLREIFTSISEWGTDVYYLDWSPDGTQLVFVANGDIHLINADGTGVRRLTAHPANEIAPRFSPDGHSVAFQRDPGSASSVVIVDLESGEERTVYGPGGVSSDSELAWSPDGKRLAFTPSNSQGEGIFIVNNDGSGLYQLTAGTVGITDLRWLTNDRISFRLGPTNVV